MSVSEGSAVRPPSTSPPAESVLWFLNDFDRVDESNLPRQILYGPPDVGELKVDAARTRLEALNPAVNIRVIPERLEPEALEVEIAEVSLVLDGSDNFTTRLAVNRGAVRSRTPLVFGAAIRLEGQVGVFLNEGRGPCYRCLYDDEDEWLGNCQGNGVLAPVPGVVGSIMAVEALKILLGVPNYDARSRSSMGCRTRRLAEYRPERASGLSRLSGRCGVITQIRG